MKVKAKKINYLVLIVSLIVVILLGLVVNTLLFYTDIQKTIRQYLYDNNSNIVSVASSTIKSKIEPIEDFANSLIKMPNNIITDDLLERKRVSYELDSLAVFNVENYKVASYIGQGEFFESYVTSQLESLKTEAKIELVEDQMLYFSIPVVVNREVKKIVIGAMSFNEIPLGYVKNSVTMVIDTNSNEVLSLSKGEHSSMDLDHINKLVNELKAQSFNSYFKDGQSFAIAQMIEGTTWASVAMINYQDWLPILTVRILGYLMLIILVLFVLVFCVYQVKKEAKKQEVLFLSDKLTGGINREGFIKEGSYLIKKYGRLNYYVVCFNVSEFRYINESFSEDAGNRTLFFIHRMLKECINEEYEVICRSNIDCFLLLLNEDSEADVCDRVEGMIEKINDWIHRDFLEFDLQFTVGACRLSIVGELVVATSNALLLSKNSKSKNKCIFYDDEMIKKKEMDKELNNLFHDSIVNRDFQIYLQPKVSQKGKCEAEALIRWIHHKKGMIFPNQFIPLFEQNGKILELDLYVFEEVCRLIAKWIENNEEVSSISVNISRYSIMNAGENIYLDYKRIKEKYHIPDDVIEIEITETALLNGNQISFVKKVLEDFKSCGLKVALDDFGFAYSSLGILKSLDVDTIKLDQSFFRDISLKSEKIVISIIQLVHSLGMKVVAEGVEKIQQVEMLYQSECDYIQGYYYSKPIPVEEFELWRCHHEKKL